MKSSDDIIRSRGTYLQMTSPEIYSRRFSEFVRHFHSDDFTDTPQLRRRLRYTTTFKSELARLNKRRETRPVAAEPTKRQRKKLPRAGSEPSFFPPISITGAEGGQSSPVTSNVLTVRSDMSTPQASKDNAPSPIPKRESQKSRNTNSLSVDKSQDMVRLSPIASSDRKSKTDGKAEKYATLTPRGSIPKISSKTNLVESHQRHERSNSLTESHNKNDKTNTDTLHRLRGKGKNSKSKSKEEPFSVRRKIEQYRRWHEEQYLQKLKRLKQDSDSVKDNEAVKTKDEQDGKEEVTDVAQILQEKARSVSVTPQTGTSQDENNNTPVAIETKEVPESFLQRANRQKSACTWKTWRDVNESDAYSDVKKYIHDNELMSTEKEGWIKAWICEVDKALCTSDCVSESDSV